MIILPLLNAVDVRVLGALIEKEITTPDYYPLSIHSLTTACNQSSNRDPVTAYDDATVLASLDRLRRLSLVRAIQPSDSRVMKYQELMAESMELGPTELAVMCVLMLRGPQTEAEVKTRGRRLVESEANAGIESTLNALIEREPALVVKVARQPGQKEARYAQLLAGEPMTGGGDNSEPAAATPVAPNAGVDRIAALEETMKEVRSEIADLRQQLEAFRKQFE